MIAIVISACLVGEPGVCRNYRIPLAYDVDANSCMMEAPPHFPEWAEAHPGWRIVRWSCMPAGTEEL